MHTCHNKQFEKDENNFEVWQLPDIKEVVSREIRTLTNNLCGI